MKKYADDPLTPVEAGTGYAQCPKCNTTIYLRGKCASPQCLQCGSGLAITPEVYGIAAGMMPERRLTYGGEL